VKEFRDKVAVITGAASGIGRGLAERCAQEGMKVVLADIEEEALAQAEKELKTTGASVLAVLTDVSKAGDIESLARKTLDTFGAIHLLFNNAGVGVFTNIWESTVADWKWVIDVNLWGVIHAIRTFVPIMLEQDTECHIINTSSASGLISSPSLGVYKVTKHGVVSLSETLYHELAQRGAKVKVSVLCPGLVSTRVMDCERNRPVELQNDTNVEVSAESRASEQAIRQSVSSGISPQEGADCVFTAIRDVKFYMIKDSEKWKPLVQRRMEDIIQDRNPTSPFQS